MKTISYKCPNCGGGLQFDPVSQGYKCEYCSSAFLQKELDILYASENEQAEEEHLAMYECPSCGAQITTDETTAATFCYYCHNPVVLIGKMQGEYRPDYVLPFKIGRDQAVRIFSDWIQKKRFVPRNFYSQSQIEKLTGVYYPYLLYSCTVDGNMEADAKQFRKWRMGDIEFTEIKRFLVQRAGKMEVNHVMRNALSKEEGELPEKVLPFNLDEMQDFKAGVLSGFVAESRNLESEAFQREVDDEVKSFAREAMRGSIQGFSNVNPHRTDMNILSPDWKYMLLPVWALTYQENGKTYYFTLNGQSGQVHGELPVDKKRLLMLFFGVFIPLFIIMLGGLLLV